MKKLVPVIILVLSMTFAAGCKNAAPVNKASSQTASQAAKAVSSENPKSQANTQSAPNNDINQTADTNSFYDPNPKLSDNLVNINPRKVYYENGKLVMQAFVTNGFNHPVYNISVNNITVSNHQGTIAKASFGVMNGAQIGAKQYILWTFTFPSSTVANKNADLSALTTHYDTAYNY